MIALGYLFAFLGYHTEKKEQIRFTRISHEAESPSRRLEKGYRKEIPSQENDGGLQRPSQVAKASPCMRGNCRKHRKGSWAGDGGQSTWHVCQVKLVTVLTMTKWCLVSCETSKATQINTKLFTSSLTGMNFENN